MKKLVYFCIPDRWPIPWIELEKVQCLGALEILHVSCTDISDLKPSMLANFPKLRCLVIRWGDGFSVASVRARSQCSKLKVFGICCELEEPAVIALVDTLSTRLIKLAVRSVPEECVEVIAKQFKKLTHIWLGPEFCALYIEELCRMSSTSVLCPSEWEGDGFRYLPASGE